MTSAFEKEKEKRIHDIHEKKERKEKKKIFIGVIILVIILGAAWMLSNKRSAASGSGSEGKIALTVNGISVAQDELNKSYRFFFFITGYPQGIIARDVFINQTVIPEMLLLSEAKRQGIVVAKDDVANAVEASLHGGGITEEDLLKRLSAEGFTMDDVLAYSEKQMTIMRFLNESLLTSVSIPDTDIEDFYQQNIGMFYADERVKARHILVTNGSEVKIEDIEAQLAPDSSNFCELVDSYSEDPGSRSTCGEYTFGRGMMVPVFEEKAFSQNAGEYGIVQTEYGYHLIQTMEKLPAGIVPFAEAKDGIAEQLLRQKQQKLIEDAISILREDAAIEIY